jgi:ribose transport system ATP-binding protein
MGGEIGDTTLADVSVSPPALEVSGLVKVYGGTVALRGVSFAIAPGEIHGLVGENGAGTSTLVRIVTGVERQDDGEFRIGGAVGAVDGCAVIHQNLALIEDISVAENIALATGYPRRGRTTSDWRATRRISVAALGRLGVSLDPDADVSTLPLAQRAIVAIARALAQDTRLVIFDEPTANLQAAEVRTLFSIMERLREGNVACLLISHRIDEVLAACDRITVLRDGGVVGTWPAAELSAPRLIEAILGRKSTTFASRVAPSGEVALRVEGLSVDAVGPVDFDVRRGEIFAITGLADAGHVAVAEALFGAKPMRAGSVTLDGAPYRPSSPRAAVAAGVAYVPPDRHREAIAAELTARENLFMRPRQRALHPLRVRAERRAARAVLDDFDVRPPQTERQLSTFSGGNQQKIVLGKWLSRPRKLVVLAEPTAAVDVGAKLQIYTMLRRASETGTAVVVASSDFEEVAMVADRVLVLYRGRAVRVIERADLAVESVTEAAYNVASLDRLVTA